MKKLLVIMLSLMMALTMFTACGQKEEQTEETITNGVVYTLGATEAELNDIAQPGRKLVVFDSLDAALIALQSEKIDRIVNLPGFVAKYVAENNDDFEAVVSDSNYSGKMLLHMATLKENTEVFEVLNEGIKTLKDNGKLDELKKIYIDNVLESGEEPATVELPKFDGAKTIKVVITGDLPPVDYIASEGTPAGFNVALLAEIAKLNNINIELVNTNSGGRLTEMTSGKADAIFYVYEGKYENSDYEDQSMLDIPDSLIITEPYIEDTNTRIVLK